MSRTVLEFSLQEVQHSVPLIFSEMAVIGLRNKDIVRIRCLRAQQVSETKVTLYVFAKVVNVDWKGEDSDSDTRYARLNQPIHCSIVENGSVRRLNAPKLSCK
jgi:hypothetical protein